MRILVTGFEPFGQDTVNASGEAVRALAARGVDHAHTRELRIETVILPVTWAESVPALLTAVAEHAPDALLCVGEAGGRTRVTPERYARNVGTGRIPDNGGVSRGSAPLDDGPGVLASRVDPDALTRSVVLSGVAAEVSEDAGEFLCNAVFRAALHRTQLPAAFVHVPAWRPSGVATVGAETDPGASSAGSPDLDLQDLVTALAACVEHMAGPTATGVEVR